MEKEFNGLLTKNKELISHKVYNNQIYRLKILNFIKIEVLLIITNFVKIYTIKIDGLLQIYVLFGTFPINSGKSDVDEFNM